MTRLTFIISIALAVCTAEAPHAQGWKETYWQDLMQTDNLGPFILLAVMFNFFAQILEAHSTEMARGRAATYRGERI